MLAEPNLEVKYDGKINQSGNQEARRQFESEKEFPDRIYWIIRI
jgi:hypothetical protein